MEQVAGKSNIDLVLPADTYITCRFKDMQCVENCNDPNPRNHVLYEQPVWQTLQMFRTSALDAVLRFAGLISYSSSLHVVFHTRRSRRDALYVFAYLHPHTFALIAPAIVI